VSGDPLNPGFNVLVGGFRRGLRIPVLAKQLPKLVKEAVLNVSFNEADVHLI